MAVTWAGAVWVASTAYVVADRVVNGGNVYRCSGAGTSASSGGPTGTGSAPITDGTVTWLYLGSAAGAVTDIAPELSATTAGGQRIFLDMADAQVPVENWNNLRDPGALYLAAHLGTLSRRRGAGPTTSEAVGGVSRGYASMLQFGTLGTTTYGVEFLRMTELLPTAFGLQVGGDLAPTGGEEQWPG